MSRSFRSCFVSASSSLHFLSLTAARSCSWVSSAVRLLLFFQAWTSSFLSSG